MQRHKLERIAWASEKNYSARVIREKAKWYEFLFKDAGSRYILEVLNEKTGRMKRKKIGYSGLIELSEEHTLLYCTLVDKLKFTEEGLEVYAKESYQIEDDIDLKPAAEDKRYFIPRTEFPL